MFAWLMEILTHMFYFTGYIRSQSSARPLSREDEERCLAALQKGDAYARDQLIEHNLRLVAHIVKKYDIRRTQTDDLISIGTIGLIKAVDTFAPEKGKKLTTYASRCIENEILMHLRSKKKYFRDISLYEPIGIDREGNEIRIFDIIDSHTDDAYKKAVLKDDIKLLYSKLESQLSPRERTVLKMRYGLYNEAEYTQREIAAELGISRSYVSRIEKSAIEKLRPYF